MERFANRRGIKHIGRVIRAVLFDIDGTLVRTGGAGVKAFERAFHLAFGHPEATRGMRFAGRTDRGLVEELFERFGVELTPGNIERFCAAYLFLLDEHLDRLAGGVCEGVERFLEDLFQVDDRPLVGLLTGNLRLGAELKLRRYGLWDHFETGAFGDGHGCRNKIAAEAQARVSRVLGRKVDGAEILVIGDTPLDIACGRSIGARTLAVATGGSGLDELVRHRPDWAVPNLGHLRAKDVCLPVCGRA